MIALCHKYSFEETVDRLGIENFSTNTPYIVTGWSSTSAEDNAGGGFCVLVSTMNLALNHARACAWYAGHVTLAVDHTFKVFLHPCLSLSCDTASLLMYTSWPAHCVIYRWTGTVILTSVSTSWRLIRALTGELPTPTPQCIVAHVLQGTTKTVVTSRQQQNLSCPARNSNSGLGLLLPRKLVMTCREQQKLSWPPGNKNICHVLQGTGTEILT